MVNRAERPTDRDGGRRFVAAPIGDNAYCHSRGHEGRDYTRRVSVHLAAPAVRYVQAWDHRLRGMPGGTSGAVTAIQRFGSALNPPARADARRLPLYVMRVFGDQPELPLGPPSG